LGERLTDWGLGRFHFLVLLTDLVLLAAIAQGFQRQELLWTMVIPHAD